MKQNKYEIDMCHGTIMDKLISFALLILISLEISSFCSSFAAYDSLLDIYFI